MRTEAEDAKQKRLVRKGWKKMNAAEFCNLTADELLDAYSDMRIKCERIEAERDALQCKLISIKNIVT